MDGQITYRDIADYFIAFSNETQSLITNLKLQKLVYYAQAWNLAIYKEELFPDEFEAWIHGPVIPALYNDYKKFAWTPIVREDLNTKVFLEMKCNFSPEITDVLNNVIGEYFEMDAYALEKSTHLEKPWIEARKGFASDDPCTNCISKESMIDFYSLYVIND